MVAPLKPNSIAPGSTLRGKFIRTMLLVSSIIGGATLAIVLILSTRVSVRHLREIEGSIEAGITSKGKLLTENHALALRGMVLDNAFVDMQTLLSRAVSGDPDLVYALFVNSDGDALAFQRRGADDGEPSKDVWKTLGFTAPELVVRRESVRRARRLGEEVVEVAVPVLGEDGEVLGTIRYGLSTRRMHQAIVAAAVDSRIQQVRSLELIGVTVGLATLLGILLSRVQAVRITRPVQELTQAASDLAAGDRGVRVNIASGDELQVLGSSFNRMVAELSHSYDELEEMNRTLEARVEDRTLALAARNQDMRLVLDNVDQGFLTLSIDGKMASERSAVVDAWFGELGSAHSFWQYLAPTSASFAALFELGWEQLVSDVLPYDVAIGQLPSRLVGSSTFSFRYLPLLRDERVEGVLVVIADITDKLQREREEAELTELMQAFRCLMLDRNEFTTFLSEASSMAGAICQVPAAADGTAQMRLLHTLKGNAAQMGLTVIAQLCHELEDEIAAGNGMKAESQAALTGRLRQIADHIAQLIEPGQATIEIQDSDYAALVSLLSRGQPAQALQEVLSWQLEPATRALGRLANQARAVARRLGRGEIEIDVQASPVRLDPQVFAPFFSDLGHVVRNAIDHGIEAPEEREALGKVPSGRVTFKANARANRLTFEISDDGRGIDWEQIRKRGLQSGLPTRTPAELLAVLCSDGVTTRSEVTQTSGRGVGMSAVKRRIDGMQGRLEVRSSPGVGTTWVIDLPWTPEHGPEHEQKLAARAQAASPRVA